MTERKPRGAWVWAGASRGCDLYAAGKLVGWSGPGRSWLIWADGLHPASARGHADTDEARRLAVEDALDEAGVAFDLADAAVVAAVGGAE